jgi:oxygen-independent coproporphyrinogen-3 oxidase
MAGLYLHIPYCRSKCAYCDFYSGPFGKPSAEEYVAAMRNEYAVRRLSEMGPDEFATIYVGGGTPSSISPQLLEPFLRHRRDDAEITIEANPDDVDTEWVEQIAALGFNRVSMGVQSLVDSELQAVGRRHSADQALRAIDTLRSRGIENISCDLIYGLPGQTIESWRYSLQRLLAEGLPHLSAYLLSYEPGTRLYAALTTGRLQEASEEMVQEMYAILCQEATAAGFQHYEISNFALPGLHSRHNSAYWDFTPYLGLGPGAHSFDGKVRRFNPPNIKQYVAASGLTTETEELSADERHNDIVITALRTARGISPDDLSIVELEEAKRTLQPTAGGRYRIAEEQWLLSNLLMEPFIRV